MTIKLLRQEHIGERVIIEHKRTGKKTHAVILDETKNTYLVRDEKNKRIKRIIKSECYIIFTNHNLRVDGEKLTKRPEDRIKMK
ncbi:hypothetical protein B6U93_04235 [Candidatus Woesearchaeota archaeon ex4484_78]|nr:MAG: hypothetical protein B6U93_04235 [Candidatus Woesearchaeota archaeon ex4484_78]